MRKYPRYRKTTDEINLIILQKIIANGNVSLDRTLDKVIMYKRDEIIQKHLEHHSIWQGQNNKKWYTKLGETKRLIGRKERGDLENAILEFYLTDGKLTPTVDDVYQDWVQYESTHTEHSMKTINEYSYEYNRFIKETDFASCPIHDVTERHIVKLLKSIVHDGEKISQKRYNAVKTVIRTLFNYAKIYMEVDCISVTHIMNDIRFPSTAFKKTNTSDATQVFKHSEVKQIKDILRDTNDLLELGILLTIETGVRVGELCTIKRDCIEGNHLRIMYSEHKARFSDGHRYYIGTTKNAKERTVVLNPNAQRIIQNILSQHDSEWLFPSKEDTADWMRSYHFDKAIRAVCRRLDIPERSMHKLRKTYASYMLDATSKNEKMTEKLVQEQLGHADIATTKRFYHYNLHDEAEKDSILGSVQIG